MATDVERLAVLFEANTKQFANAMAKLQKDSNRALGGVQKSVASLDRQLNALSARASKVAGLFGMTLGLAGLRQLGVVIGDVVKRAGDMVDTADKLGITTKALQELKFAAGQTGVDFGDLTGALSFFNKQIGEASRGGGDLLAILKANNVAIRDQAGNLLPPTEILGRYADLVMNASTAQERATLVTKAFGKSSDELINTLSLGRQGLADYAAQADRTGQIIEDGLLRRAEALGDKWAEVSGKMSTDWSSFVLTVVEGALTAGTAVDNFIEDIAKKMGLRSAPEIKLEDSLGANQLRALQELTTKLQGGGAASGGGVDRFAAAFGGTVLPSTASTIPIKPAKPIIDADTEALKALEAQLDSVRDTAREVLGTFVDDLLAGKSLTESLGDALQDLAKKLIDSGLDRLISQLFGASGTTSTGLIGSLFGGLFADGGTLGAGKWGIAGERGPEIIRGPASISPIGGGAANSNRPVVQNINVVVNGARGNQEIRSMVFEGVSRGIAANNKEVSRHQARAG